MKYLFFILFISNFAWGQTEEKPYMEVWTLFSDDSFINSNAHRIASQKWPFTIYSMSGSVVLDEKIVDSVQKNNQTIWQYLDSHGRKNSKKQYLHDFYIERNAINKAIQISRNKIDLTQYKPKESSYLHTKFYVGITKIKDNIYQFNIFMIDYNKPYSQEELIVKYTIDIKNETITIIQKKNNVRSTSTTTKQ